MTVSAIHGSGYHGESRLACLGLLHPVDIAACHGGSSTAFDLMAAGKTRISWVCRGAQKQLDVNLENDDVHKYVLTVRAHKTELP